MKNIYCLLVAAGCSFTALAQTGSDISRWYLGINGRGGVHTYDAEQVDFAKNYLNVVNPDASEVVYTPGNSVGFEVQVGYFIDKKANFGIGTGLIYLQQSGDASLDRFHVEYESRDFTNDVYRQIIHLNTPIAEDIKSTNVNIPLVLKYRANLSKAFGFSIDAGIVYNLSMRHQYTTNASFNYEALYKFQRMSDGNFHAVYDGGSVPDQNNWAAMTVKEYAKTNPKEDVNEHFETLREQGYNVGLNQKPRSAGYKSYKSGSIGFLVQPSVSFRLTDAVSISVGGYYMHQTFEVSGTESYQLTSLVGSYNSIMGAQKNVKMQNYGGSLGLGFNL
jgi:hypothetical protein